MYYCYNNSTGRSKEQSKPGIIIVRDTIVQMAQCDRWTSATGQSGLVRRGSFSEIKTVRNSYSPGKMSSRLHVTVSFISTAPNVMWSFIFSERNCLRIYSRVFGQRVTRVHGLQTRCTPRRQSRIPVVSFPVRTHVDSARNIQEGRKM